MLNYMCTAIISCGVAFTIKWCVDVQLCNVNVKIKFALRYPISQCDPDELYMECDAQLCYVQFFIHTMFCKLLLDCYRINLPKCCAVLQLNVHAELYVHCYYIMCCCIHYKVACWCSVMQCQCEDQILHRDIQFLNVILMNYIWSVMLNYVMFSFMFTQWSASSCWITTNKFIHGWN